MTKKNLFPLIAILLLTSCNQGTTSSSITDEKEVSFVSCVGLSSLAFYSEGDNPNFGSGKNDSLVLMELQSNYYDVVIAPLYEGLTSIRKNKLDFALATTLTYGNLFLVGLNQEEGEVPAEGDNVVSFASESITAKATAKLLKDKYEVSTLNYVNDVSNTLSILQTGKYNNDDVDYVLTCEPILTKSKVSSNVIIDVKSEWATLTKQVGIPQLGAFVRKSSLETKPTKMKEFFKELDGRLTKLIAGSNEIKTALHEFSEDITEQENRFGVNENNVDSLLINNKLGFAQNVTSTDINTFLVSLNLVAFSDEYFAQIN